MWIWIIRNLFYWSMMVEHLCRSGSVMKQVSISAALPVTTRGGSASIRTWSPHYGVYIEKNQSGLGAGPHISHVTVSSQCFAGCGLGQVSWEPGCWTRPDRTGPSETSSLQRLPGNTSMSLSGGLSAVFRHNEHQSQLILSVVFF